mmetsp:Transcript_1074/g.1472  ORF Transcript_1074/g.1472 Transcript_1074/m.1472 type:complete len:89 (-) Transcript_1074:1127-1393(-)
MEKVRFSDNLRTDEGQRTKLILGSVVDGLILMLLKEKTVGGSCQVNPVFGASKPKEESYHQVLTVQSSEQLASKDCCWLQAALYAIDL